MSGDFNVSAKATQLGEMIDQSAFAKGTVKFNDSNMNALNCEFASMKTDELKAVLAHMSASDKLPKPDTTDATKETNSIIFFKTQDDRGLFVDLSVNMCAQKLEKQ